MLLELSKGFAFLLSLVLLQYFVLLRWGRESRIGAAVSGVLFGGITVVGMITPVVLQPGIIFDARSVVLGLAGFFGGPITGTIAAAAAAAYRLEVGGAGAPVGIAVILSSMAIGLAYRHLHRRGRLPAGRFVHFLVFGLVVQGVAVLWFLALPAGVVEEVFSRVVPPFLLTFVPATAILGRILQDIYDRIERTAGLAARERRYRDLYDKAPIPYLTVDLLDGGLHDFNDAAVEFFGYPPGELAKMHVFDLFDPGSEGRRRVAQIAASLRRGRGQPVRDVELSFRRKDGTEVWGSLSADTVLDPLGTPRQLRCIIVDISHRRRAETTLQGIIDSILVGVVTVDENGRIRTSNPAADAMFGVAPGGLTDHHFNRLLAEPVAGFAPCGDAAAFARAASRMVGTSLEATGRRGKDGTFPMLFGIGEARLGDRRTFIVSIVDLSEQKALEAQLQQAQRLQTVGQLTGGIAHDFNNLLAVVLGNLDMAEELLGDNRDLRRLIVPAIRAAERGADLTQRLLAFSRRQVLKPRSIDVNQLVRESVELLQRTIGESIRIEILYGDSLWPCRVDPTQLQSSLINLALNGRDAMPDGGVLTIETENMTLDEAIVVDDEEIRPGRYVSVSVGDTGTGMPPEVLERVFEPFYSTKEPGEGNGLGLSMVYGFAKQSGGYVTVYSEPGRGTTVKIYLPASEAPVAEATARSNGRDRETDGHGAGETILVVEDSPEVRDTAKRILVELGYTVLTADDGEAALAALAGADDVRLILTDVVLTGAMSGPALARRVAERRPEIKILFMSGYTPGIIALQGEIDPDTDLIQKPFKKADLAAKVHAVLNG